MPAIWQACMTVTPAGTSISRPSIVIFGMVIFSCLRLRLFGGKRSALCLVLGNPSLQLRAEMANQALDRPGGGIAQGTDGMAFHLLADVEQHVDFLDFRLADHHSAHNPVHPAGTLAARRTLAAGFVHVEMAE